MGKRQRTNTTTTHPKLHTGKSCISERFYLSSMQRLCYFVAVSCTTITFLFMIRIKTKHHVPYTKVCFTKLFPRYYVALQIKRFNCNIPLNSKALCSVRIIVQRSPGSTQDRKLSQHDSNFNLDVTHQNKQTKNN